MSGSLFTRTPEWLREALGLQEPDLPNRLGDVGRRVEPVLDIWQGGFSRGFTFLQTNLLQIGVFGPSTINLVTTRGTNSDAIIWAATGIHAAGAGAIVAAFELEGQGLAGVTVTQATITNATAVLIGAASKPLFVPNGLNFRGIWPVLAAGEQLEYRVLHSLVPKGSFRPY